MGKTVTSGRHTKADCLCRIVTFEGCIGVCVKLQQHEVESTTKELTHRFLDANFASRGRRKINVILSAS